MLKIGFVGCGWANGMHMRNLAGLDGVSLAAFYDPDESRAQQAAAQYHGTAYTDSAKLVAEAELDVLYVAVPPGAHGIEPQAAQRGLHIFAEKPIATQMSLACEIAAAIEGAGVVSAVGYHFRYLDACRKAKALLADKTVGMLLGYWVSSMPPVEWWRQMALSGGQAVEQTTHIFDLARWLVGEVEEVFAFQANRASQDIPKFDIWDVGAVNLKFKNGVVGTMHSSCLVEQNFRIGLDVICKDLTLAVDGNRLAVTEPGRKEEFSFSNDYYLEEDKAFIAAIQSGDKAAVQSPYADALQTLAVTLAATRSATEARPVCVVEMFGSA